MTNDEINAAISAWFEPKQGPWALPDADVSKKGFWKWSVFSCRWEPTLDFFRSEDANARLLEAMPEVDLCRDGTAWRCDPYDNTEIGTSVYDPDRKTAVVLAFCRFTGIEVLWSYDRS